MFGLLWAHPVMGSAWPPIVWAICNFSPAKKGGKVAFPSLPLLRTAVKLHVRVILLSERRKSGTRNFPADGYGGKAARATFPPLSQPFLYSTSLACDSINFWLP